MESSLQVSPAAELNFKFSLIIKHFTWVKGMRTTPFWEGVYKGLDMFVSFPSALSICSSSRTNLAGNFPREGHSRTRSWLSLPSSTGSAVPPSGECLVSAGVEIKPAEQLRTTKSVFAAGFQWPIPTSVCLCERSALLHVFRHTEIDNRTEYYMEKLCICR